MLAVCFTVALRKESVDRNQFWPSLTKVGKVVALRKESVDRNHPPRSEYVNRHPVALRKESVDRNLAMPRGWNSPPRRSPQGERG